MLVARGSNVCSQTQAKVEVEGEWPMWLERAWRWTGEQVQGRIPKVKPCVADHIFVLPPLSLKGRSQVPSIARRRNKQKG